MPENPRKFEAGPDPFGRKWSVTLHWLQTAISIRHSDSVDVKFVLTAEDGTAMEKVVALMLPHLMDVSKRLQREISDPWCIRLAGAHLRTVISTWEDAEKTIVTPSREQVEECARTVQQAVAAVR